MSTHKISESPPLISITILFIIVLESTATMIISARELRPSDHGLAYYYEPDDDDESSKEMTSFFGPPSSSSSNEMTSSSSSSSPYGSTLPSAVRSPMTTSSRDDDDDDDDGHVMRHVLVVGSLVCGVSGVGLMVASGLIYFLGYSRQIHNNTT